VGNLQDELILREIAMLPEPYQTVFETLVMNGETYALAHMLTMRQAPQMKQSSRAFDERAYYRMSNMNEEMRGKMQKTAMAHGISTDGKYYVSGLGPYSDPKAWVSSPDDILAVAKERNMTVSGGVTHQGEPVEPVKKDLAEDIVDTYIGKILQSEPRTREKVKKGKLKRQDLRDRVVAKHGKQKPRSL